MIENKKYGKIRLSQNSVWDIVIADFLRFMVLILIFFILLLIFFIALLEDNYYLLGSTALLSFPFTLVITNYLYRIKCKRNLFYDDQAIYKGENILVMIKDIVKVKRASWWAFSHFYSIKFKLNKNKTSTIHFYVVSDEPDFPSSIIWMLSGDFLNENQTIAKLKFLIDQKSR